VKNSGQVQRKASTFVLRRGHLGFIHDIFSHTKK